jgi:hypothetical protein
LVVKREAPVTLEGLVEEMHDEDARIPIDVLRRWLLDVAAGTFPVDGADEWLCGPRIRAWVAASGAEVRKQEVGE